MAEVPWLTIIGLGEDGPEGLTNASRTALHTAEVVMGAARHLALLPDITAEVVEWPVPFSDGLSRLLTLRGRKTVVLASGDPFWFGAGSVIARQLEPGEWRAVPGLSCFSLTAARLGWPIEQTVMLGLHAAPMSRLRPHLAPGARIIVTLRDGAAVADLARYLSDTGFADSTLHMMEAIGGPREVCRQMTLSEAAQRSFAHPVCAGIDVVGHGAVLPSRAGLADDWFDHDGQITKRPVRAVTLSALSPCAGARLWDIGGGSGSIAIEWLLAGSTMQATCIEAKPERAARIKTNAARLGVDRLSVVTGSAPDALAALQPPDAVFVGGGLSPALLGYLYAHAKGARLVVNAVTLESEALLTAAHAEKGGELMQLAISEARPLGALRGWIAARPIVQWSVTL